jgi:gluconokinase
LRLHWEFEDADWFHPAANIEKMHSGVALTDEAIAAWIDETCRSGGHGVMACSALKRRYRPRPRGDAAPRPELEGIVVRLDVAPVQGSQP